MPAQPAGPLAPSDVPVANPGMFASPAGGIGAALGGSLISFGASLIIGFIGSLFGGLFGGNDNAAINKTLNDMRESFTKAIDTAYRFTWKGLLSFGWLLSMFHDLWVNALRPALEKIADLFKRIGRLITKSLIPMFNALQKLKQFLDYVYKNFIRPALIILQRVRRVLAILRIFHIKFAGQLDNILLRVQARVLGPFLYTIRLLNGIGSWVNVIITAKGTIQHALFLNSMYAFQADWVNMFWWGQQSSVVPGGPTFTTAQASAPSPTQVQSEFAQYVSADAGRYADQGQRTSSAFSATLAS